MKITLKLFLLSTALVAVTLAVAEVYLTEALDDQLTNRIRADLLVRARLVADRVAALDPRLRDARAMDALADRLSQAAGARVTLVRRNGTVAGDSEIPLAGLAAMENHAMRPEIEQSVATGEGSSVRYSATLKQRMMYAAVPARSDGAVVGSARLAMPLDSVEEAVRDLHRTLLAGGLLALVVALIVAFTAVYFTGTRVRSVTDTARRMAAGNLSARARMSGRDEIAVLGQVLDQLADNLSANIDALRGERNLLSGVLDGMREGVLVVGPDRRMTLVNRALRDMLLIAADPLGKPLLAVIRNAELDELIARAARGETAEAELSLSGLRPRRVLARAAALHEPTGGVLAVLVDITELRRLESVRRDFVANASHELKSPLTAVRAAVETLQGFTHESPDQERFVEVIARNTERIDALIGDLLEIARLESGELELRPEMLPARECLERVVGRHAVHAQTKSIELDCSAEPDLAVRADARALEHVLDNLVDNALKYCPPGARVRLSARAERTQVRFQVADTGPGISAEHLPRLFERFYRVDAGRSRELGGTGLGLSIVKHLVEAMGGSVAVDSSPGAGSTFSFALPAS